MDGAALALLTVLVLVAVAAVVVARAPRAGAGFTPFSACGINARVFPSDWRGGAAGAVGPQITPNGASFERALRRAGAPPYTGNLPPIRLRGCVGAE